MKKLAILSALAAILIVACSKSEGLGSNDNGTTTGQGGSMAAMTIKGDYLYRLQGGNTIEVYDISEDSSAKLVNTVNAGDGLETIFPYGDYLFLGTNTGMLIYDVKNGRNPAFVSRYDHVFSCDPVVVQGNYAYVTLRSGGTRCFRTLNQLEIIDISDIQNPSLLKAISMLNPHGLDADGDNLVVGEGTRGFKWFDISDPVNPVLTSFQNTVPGYDVISLGDRFILVGDKGLYQYGYDKANSKLNLISIIPVNRQ